MSRDRYRRHKLSSKGSGPRDIIEEESSSSIEDANEKTETPVNSDSSSVEEKSVKLKRVPMNSQEHAAFRPRRKEHRSGEFHSSQQQPSIPKEQKVASGLLNAVTTNNIVRFVQCFSGSIRKPRLLVNAIHTVDSSFLDTDCYEQRSLLHKYIASCLYTGCNSARNSSQYRKIKQIILDSRYTYCDTVLQLAVSRDLIKLEELAEQRRGDYEKRGHGL